MTGDEMPSANDLRIAGLTLEDLLGEIAVARGAVHEEKTLLLLEIGGHEPPGMSVTLMIRIHRLDLLVAELDRRTELILGEGAGESRRGARG